MNVKTSLENGDELKKKLFPFAALHDLPDSLFKYYTTALNHPVYD
jgi:hypothetical protein